MKKYIYISLIFVTLLSCTKTIDFDDEGLANQVVVNSIISTDNWFTAYLTKSSSILEDRQNNPPLEGTLDLYEDGNLIRQFPSQLGGFSATDIKPKAGKSYRIVITSNGKQIEAETILPNQTEVISLDTITIKDQNNYKRLNYKLKLKDQAGDDYYRIVVTDEGLTVKSDDKGSRKYYMSRNQNSINSDDPVFNSLYNNFGGEAIDMGPSNDYYIFPDDYFKGKEYMIQFQTNSYSYNSNYSNGYGSSKQIYTRNVIHIQKLSKDLFTYLKYLKLYNHYHDNPFSEPVPVYSNIKNGIGIFAGFNDDAKFTFEKTFVPYSMDTIKVEPENGGSGYHY
jgi:hypothetical protein